jgi:hypothetical protein
VFFARGPRRQSAVGEIPLWADGITAMRTQPPEGRARQTLLGQKTALKPLKSLCRGPECALAFRFARPERPGRPLGLRRRAVDDCASSGTTTLEGERPQSRSFARPPAPPLSAS